jgi:hypothetical protein
MSLLQAPARATPPGWCARCGFAPCIARLDENCITEDDGTCYRDATRPLPLQEWLALTAGEALAAVGLRWDGDPGLVRALGEHIARRA